MHAQGVPLPGGWPLTVKRVQFLWKPVQDFINCGAFPVFLTLLDLHMQKMSKNKLMNVCKCAHTYLVSYMQTRAPMHEFHARSLAFTAPRSLGQLALTAPIYPEGCLEECGEGCLTLWSN